MTTRRTATQQLPPQVPVLAWAVTFGLLAILGIAIWTFSVWAHQAITARPEVLAPPSAVQQNCGPTSNEPCTEREARLALQAKVDSFAKPTMEKHLENIKKYEHELTDARVAQAKADAEAAKAQWERMRYRELQEELKSSQPSPAPSPNDVVSCDASPWTRSHCDTFSR